MHSYYAENKEKLQQLCELSHNCSNLDLALLLSDVSTGLLSDRQSSFWICCSTIICCIVLWLWKLRCLILIRGIWDNLEPTLRQLTE